MMYLDGGESFHSQQSMDVGVGRMTTISHCNRPWTFDKIEQTGFLIIQMRTDQIFFWLWCVEKKG